MTERLSVPYDILSDIDEKFINNLNLPTFTILEKNYIKRLTMIIERSIIKKVFYPIASPKKHIIEVLEWLKIN